ncbi:MAG TPA: hypothetical protein VLA64_15785 [Azonexus sp.]|nr:hypothetical protein [Azonexus sp.]
MKLPFVLAGACIISGSLVGSSLIQAKTMTLSSAALVISDTKPLEAAKIKEQPSEDLAEETSKKPAVDQGEKRSTAKPQVTRVTEEQAAQRARSFFLLLQILRTSK